MVAEDGEEDFSKVLNIQFADIHSSMQRIAGEIKHNTPIAREDRRTKETREH